MLLLVSLEMVENEALGYLNHMSFYSLGNRQVNPRAHSHKKNYSLSLRFLEGEDSPGLTVLDGMSRLCSASKNMDNMGKFQRNLESSYSEENPCSISLLIHLGFYVYMCLSQTLCHSMCCFAIFLFSPNTI